MINDADRRHLKAVAGLARHRYLIPGIITVGVVILLGSAMDVYTAAKYAGVQNVTWGDVMLLVKGRLNLGGISSCAGLRALDLLSTAVWQAIAGIFVISQALSLKRRGRFYDRLRRALYVGNP
jgi:hypothetical protein